MAQITAALVKELRDATNLPMMKCKAALAETGGDIEAAKQLLRKEGEKFIEGRGDRSTEEGRIAIYTGVDKSTGAMVELQCESAPVASNEEFVQLATDLVTQLATGPGAADAEALWAQPSPSRSGLTLAEQRDELANKIREVFRLARIVRIDGSCGGYVHHDAKNAVIVEVEGGTDELVKDVSMHIVAIRPGAVSKEDIDPAAVAKEREFLMDQARGEGKPENIIEKMVEGRMRNYYAEHALLEQPFVKDDKQTVGKYAAAGNMKIKQFVLWQLGG